VERGQTTSALYEAMPSQASESTDANFSRRPKDMTPHCWESQAPGTQHFLSILFSEPSPLSKNNFLIVLIALGLLGGIYSFTQRWAAEARNRRVEIVVDYADAQALANTTRRATPDVLRALKASGVTTIAVTEDTPSTLYQNGVLASYRRDGDTTLLTFSPGFPGQMPRVQEMLAHKAPGLAVTSEGANTLRIGAPWPQFSGLPIGLDNDVVTSIRQAGLFVAPRLSNFTGVTADNIGWTIAQAQQQITPPSAGPYIFAGAAVLGNRGLIRATADALRAHDLVYGSVEFSKTFGDDDLSRLASDRTVRVHSIGNDEMGLMDEPTAVERFVRAARERNIRVCYVRLFLSGLTNDPDAIHANTEFIGKVVKGIQGAYTTTQGPLTIGKAHPFRDDPTPALWARILMGVGVMAGTVLLLSLFTGLDGTAFAVALSLALLVGIGLALPHLSVKGREILALLAACVFPTLGLCYYALPQASYPLPLGTGTVLGRAFAAYARMTLATVAGIVFVVGLLAGRLFLLKVDAFLGVKLVLVAPVVLVLAYYGLGLAQLGPGAGWAERVARVKQSLAALSAQPLLVGQIVVGFVALVALALFVARSGNDPGVGVSGTELKVRSLLDKYLLVRPRTKEFLLGHPALFVGLAAAYAGRFPRAILPLLVVGAIGQSSLLDTFCHLHTPLFISVLRGLIGWALGAVIGALICVALGREVPQKAAVRV